MTKTIQILILCAITSTALAGTKSFQASLAPGIAIHDRQQKIEGLSLSVWGENPQTSLALGIINGTVGNSAGLSLGFVNYGDDYKGIQFGFLNIDAKLHGAQIGLLNFSKTTKSGFQFGLINIIAKNKKWFSNFPNEIAPFMLFVNWRLEK